MENPKTPTEIRNFLGLGECYCRVIQDLFKIGVLLIGETGKRGKLGPRFSGPFKIIARRKGNENKSSEVIHYQGNFGDEILISCEYANECILLASHRGGHRENQGRRPGTSVSYVFLDGCKFVLTKLSSLPREDFMFFSGRYFLDGKNKLTVDALKKNEAR
ncbi:hypothetical protein OSB04_024143 [Centaurea solstitialis]|uniref:Uncharacterized protein n=1 Tax=Centaurea solstitialis TaxID=347529 RepID=A0AA38SXA4_9ASTR|nr:hypothetical protein OSB04_024143 [Centaurea solstitialis]